MRKIKQAILVTLFGSLLIAGCKSDDTAINITLHDKPLPTIKSYTQGKWKLQKVAGGVIYQVIKPNDGSYMNISGERILIGNDKVGVSVDTVIIWRKDKNIFGDSTYLLGYKAYKYYNSPIYYVVDQIKNGTLIIVDNTSDPFYYSYSR